MGQASSIRPEGNTLCQLKITTVVLTEALIVLVVTLCRYYQPYVDDADERITYYTRKEKEATTRAEKDSWNKRVRQCREMRQNTVNLANSTPLDPTRPKIVVWGRIDPSA
jgi:hypothetical protein